MFPEFAGAGVIVRGRCFETCLGYLCPESPVGGFAGISDIIVLYAVFVRCSVSSREVILFDLKM